MIVTRKLVLKAKWMRNVGPNVRVRNVLLCWFSCVRSPVFVFFLESQFPCYQLHIVPSPRMPLPPLKVVCKSFHSCILQICGQCCSVCVNQHCRISQCATSWTQFYSAVENGLWRVMVPVKASRSLMHMLGIWGKQRKKQTCLVQESQHCISFSWLFFFSIVLLLLLLLVAFWSPSLLPSFKTGGMCPFLWESFSYGLTVSSSFLPVSLLWCASQWLLENLCHWQSRVASPLSKEVFFYYFVVSLLQLWDIGYVVYKAQGSSKIEVTRCANRQQKVSS